MPRSTRPTRSANWVQTGWQSANKGRHDHTGRLACAAHVATYTATAALFLTVMVAATGAHLNLACAAAGLAVSGVSHYWIDRRFTLAALTERLGRIGKDSFYRLGTPRTDHDDNPTLGTGAYALDQSAHVLFLFVAALIIAAGAR